MQVLSVEADVERIRSRIEVRDERRMVQGWRASRLSEPKHAGSVAGLMSETACWTNMNTRQSRRVEDT